MDSIVDSVPHDKIEPAVPFPQVGFKPVTPPVYYVDCEVQRSKIPSNYGSCLFTAAQGTPAYPTGTQPADKLFQEQSGTPPERTGSNPSNATLPMYTLVSPRGTTLVDYIGMCFVFFAMGSIFVMSFMLGASFLTLIVMGAINLIRNI